MIAGGAYGTSETMVVVVRNSNFNNEAPKSLPIRYYWKRKAEGDIFKNI